MRAALAEGRHTLLQVGQRLALVDRRVRVVVRMLVGAVRHLVAGRLGIGPQPGDRPQQAAEHQRQQAERPDGLELRVMALVRDFLWHDVQEPEDHDPADRDDEEDEDGQEVRHLVFELRREQRGVCGGRKGQRPCKDEQADEDGARGVMRPSGSVVGARIRRHERPLDSDRARSVPGRGRTESELGMLHRPHCTVLTPAVHTGEWRSQIWEVPRPVRELRGSAGAWRRRSADHRV